MAGKVLVVDDEKLIRVTLKQVLSKAGFEVVTATSGAEALAVTEKDVVDVFILDLKMPDMNGVQLCKMIKERNPISCVYALTAHAGDYHVDQCRAAGFDDYFLKPFKTDSIIRKVQDGLEKVSRWKQQPTSQ